MPLQLALQTHQALQAQHPTYFPCNPFPFAMPLSFCIRAQSVGSRASSPDSLRTRVCLLAAPALRLVLALAAALPESGAVRADALAFVGAHARLMERVLREASSAGERTTAIITLHCSGEYQTRSC